MLFEYGRGVLQEGQMLDLRNMYRIRMDHHMSIRTKRMPHCALFQETDSPWRTSRDAHAII